MRTGYLVAITESVDVLAAREKALRGQALRLLKTRQVISLAQCVRALGYHERQVKRWWRQYRQRGLDDLLTIQTAPGQATRVSVTLTIRGGTTRLGHCQSESVSLDHYRLPYDSH